jgi:hypothetical protein
MHRLKDEGVFSGETDLLPIHLQPMQKTYDCTGAIDSLQGINKQTPCQQ